MSRPRVFLLSLALAASALVPTPGFAEPRPACAAAASSASPLWVVFQVGFPRLAALWEKIGSIMDPAGSPKEGPSSVIQKIGSRVDPDGQPLPAAGEGSSEGSVGFRASESGIAGAGTGNQ